MPSATPSVARVSNVIEALQKAGLTPGEVVVAADGSFVVKVRTVDANRNPDAGSPPKWGYAAE